MTPGLPSGLVTVTSTAPAGCAGVVTVRVVDDPPVTVAGTPPKLAAVPWPPKLLPVMVTLVPPAAGPAGGLTALMLGPAATPGRADRRLFARRRQSSDHIL
jgi:hypothetical protein